MNHPSSKHLNNTIQEDFLEITGIQQVISMFNLISDALFWIKDEESRFIYVNQTLIQHMGVDTIEEVVGKTDFDFAPPHIAKQFVADDVLVMDGKVVDERLELNILNTGELCWFTTSKRRITNENGDVIGSYGISRQLEKRSKTTDRMATLKAPVEYVRNNYMKDISIKELADIACVSVSALERRFRKLLSKTPKQFIVEVRLENARRLLVDTSLPVSVIASNTGFSDHSYFSRQFVKQFGESPKDFRNRYKDQNENFGALIGMEKSDSDDP